MHLLSTLMTTWLVLSGAAGGSGSDPGPAWPLDLETRYLTSNFMEYREGRFHAGIDLKTRSRSGSPVRAVESGWISRIRYRTGGYGKALYLRGESGRTYVYAHLQRIADRFAVLVAGAQERHLQYDVTLNFPAGRHTVRKGDLLALSGQSGTKGPHLHFEVRDRLNRPVDPQGCGFDVGDALPPEILRIRVHPCAPQTRIEGGTLARSVGDGRPLSGDLPPLHVHGPVAFSAEINDRSDRRGHRLEPARVRVTLDDSLVFAARNRVFAFEDAARMRLEWLVQGQRRERWLMRRPGNDLPGRMGGRWSLDPAVMIPGAHTVALRIEDAAGNAAVARWRLMIDDEPSEAGPAGWERDPARVSFEHPDGTGADWLSPFLRSSSGGGVEALPDPVFGDAPVFRFRRCDLDAAVVAAAERRQGLIWTGDAVEVICADWLAPEPVRLAGAGIEAAPTGTTAAYRLQESGDWVHVGPLLDGRCAPAIEIDRPALYAVFTDTQRPYLGPGPFEGLVRGRERDAYPGLGLPFWETIELRMEDLGAGIDPASIVVHLDGTRIVPEPDLPRDRLLIELPDVLESGGHRLEVGVSDQAGNPAERRYMLDLVR